MKEKQVNQVKLGARFIADKSHRKMHDEVLWQTRIRRDKCAAELPEWEQLRDLAAQIKDHTLTHLDKYLDQFEKKLVENGVKVHWVETPEEQNALIYALFKKKGVKSVTKGKSMTQDECGTQKFLEARGIEIAEGDLGCRIQQLDNQRDSHIVMPSIHKTCGDVAKLFARTLGSDPNRTSPHYLNSVMRADLRPRYVRADAGMTGVNYALADSGTLTICTNEGDADISALVPPLYVVTMGIDKLIPSRKELAVFIRLLTRSALGYTTTQYTTHITRPRPGQEMHVVILDNGRSRRLAQKEYWQVLRCIRCATCMNTCPVFRRTSGISYDAVYMGPLGLALEPSYDLYRYARLPYSCTHCGSCGDVCPVKIPIPHIIFYWRSVVVAHKDELFSHRATMDAAYEVLKSADNLAKAEKIGLWALRNIPKEILQGPLNPWASQHDDPIPPEQTFREYYKSHKMGEQTDHLPTQQTQQEFSQAAPSPEADSRSQEPTAEVPKPRKKRKGKK